MTEHKHDLFKLNGKDFYSFPYREIGAQGVGKNHTPMVNMDPYIDHSQDQAMHLEACRGLALSDNYKIGMTYGAIPPEERSKFNDSDSWSEVLRTLEGNDPTGEHLRVIGDIQETARASGADEQYAVYKYLYFALGAPIPWYFALYLKKGDFFKKTNDTHSSWTPDAEKFPTIVKYLDTLPFKSIGRVLFFTTYPNAGVMMHRDSIVTEHSDHNINLFFCGGRPSYVYDEITKQKTYLDPNAKSYFFNNRDYHGVDPEPRFRYTLRVDGTFTDDMCDALGLVDGKTWTPGY